MAAETENTTQKAVSSDPEVLAIATFPESNVFNHVTNGQKTNLVITLENKSKHTVTLQAISAALLNPDTNALTKNLTSMKYKAPLLENVKMQIPFSFYSETKPGDHRLNIWVEHSTEAGKFKVEAYDGIVTIVDPDFSIFDFKLLTSYAMVLLILGGAGYAAYVSFVPQPKKGKKAVAGTSSVSEPVAVTATGAGGYQEEWIPEHHLKKGKGGKKTLTSGDELSGAETSGTEGRRRKGKK
ncbi:hypothetical protein CPB83DRAFT_890781 [Crepidotus variabilis]|uniref:Translocon-associated protein subunit alpha n=1 Tax=Crepidotus variabilis TaxID=179855 RepID=A0A9P6EP86_9AGAR|nr:hypothetical protein CPB83DRAFT_890781 [Crepidotus variabilis]